MCKADILNNAAIVPAGTNGSVDVFASQNTDFVLDINGYFVPAASPPPGALVFVPMTPCRVVDTRASQNFPSPFGAPSLVGGGFTSSGGPTRTFPIPTSTNCTIPSNAMAYSFNVTVVPPGSLGFVTMWPTGQMRPNAVTVDDVQGLILNNAAIVPAGTNGSVDVFASQNTDFVVDINGYFVPATTGSGPTITDFNPKTGPIGTLITVTGANFGTMPQVTLLQLGGGNIGAPLTTSSSTSLSFAIPAGAATGLVTVSAGGFSASSAVALTVVPSTGFTIAAGPPTANLIQGQSTAYAISLSTTSGFNQLAQLSVSGLPAGVTQTFKPSTITAGQTSILTLTAPAGQAIGAANLTFSASATVDGLPVTSSAPASLSVVAPTTTLIGRTVVTDALETPIASVTITTLGLDGNGNTTGCTNNTTVSDGAGNFALTNLSSNCTGLQLIRFNGATATAPPGKYDGVNLIFTLNSGQVTASPVLVHLPRVDTAETFPVQQNAASNQSYSFTSIPGLSVTVYAGTTLTLPDGTQPNPFPLSCVQVPTDRLPDAKPNQPNMIAPFFVSFQPNGSTASQPVAVSYPNTMNTAPGTDMPLMTLDPTRGTMVPYGTATVSADGTQVVPDPDSMHPGHLYGLMHFDWHGVMPATTKFSPGGD